MAGRGATSFLKRQKEMNRTAKANAKRQAQQARRDDRQAGIRGESPYDEVVFPTEDEEAGLEETSPENTSPENTPADPAPDKRADTTPEP